MKNFCFSLLLFCIPFFALMPDHAAVEEAETTESCTYTMYKSDVSSSIWDAITGGQYTTYAIVVVDAGGTQVEASDFNDSSDYDQMISDLCLIGTPSFVIIDEIDGT